MRKTKTISPWSIIVDPGERKVWPSIYEASLIHGIPARRKHLGDPWGPDGDYIICHNGKPVIAFERKTVTDCASSIINGRLDDQLSRYLKKFPHTGFIIEWSNYIPRQVNRALGKNNGEIIQMALTRASELAWRLPTLVSMSPAHTAHLLFKLIKDGYLEEML